jgi:RNA polymerase primary sigma factor
MKYLTLEQELELGKLMREGTIEQSKNAEDKLASHYIDMVHNLANKFAKTSNIGADEFFSEGLLGLNYAIKNYDYHRGAKFGTFAYKPIQHKMIKIIRSYKKRDIETEWYDSYNENLNFSDKKNEPSYEIEQEELEQRLFSNFENLPNREKVVLSKRFLELSKLTQIEIASMLKLSKQRIAQIEKKGLERLKKFLKHEKETLGIAI